jgi:hypothetical protein
VNPSRRKPLIVSAIVVGVACLVAAYVLTLPQGEYHRARAPQVANVDPAAELDAQASADRKANQDENHFQRVAQRVHAADTPLVDACTGKSIKPGAATVDITTKRDCPARPPKPKPEPKRGPPKPRRPHSATQGAQEAVFAIGHECGADYGHQNKAALSSSISYLLNEARTRPTFELISLLHQAFTFELEYCHNLRRAQQLTTASGHVLDAVRPHNRFLDGPKKH